MLLWYHDAGPALKGRWRDLCVCVCGQDGGQRGVLPVCAAFKRVAGEEMQSETYLEANHLQAVSFRFLVKLSRHRFQIAAIPPVARQTPRPKLQKFRSCAIISFTAAPVLVHIYMNKLNLFTTSLRLDGSAERRCKAGEGFMIHLFCCDGGIKLIIVYSSPPPTVSILQSGGALPALR